MKIKVNANIIGFPLFVLKHEQSYLLKTNLPHPIKF